LEELELTVFLLGDGVVCAKRGLLLACETCMAARGLKQEDLIAGCHGARLGELGTATLEADKVLTF
jgi:uncharacterized protein involved in oxidation of intracellular sulfur